ncbi:hypothetical protein [Candidatus Amarolinea dominans]|uniref:hypothetical protein n=1 Tax=Candidatus Amarolinea dominans TaxID=3140696 RepID=UPI001E1090C3|nr:PD40 domain-containing protein [Anaerolineae bacterium]
MTITPAAVTALRAGTGLRGRLIFSVANMEARRWELWEHDFGSGQDRRLFDWRSQAAWATSNNLLAYYGWPQEVGLANGGLWIMNGDYTSARLVLPRAGYPSWAPDGRQLIVERSAAIFLVNSDGSGLRQLTAGAHPAWSPQDSAIAHRACPGGACGIYLTDARTGAQRRLTSGADDDQPAWSADGRSLAFVAREDGHFHIYRIAADGAGLQKLTDGPADEGLPVWSPDGNWIAFRSNRNGVWAVYVMPATGAEMYLVAAGDLLPTWLSEKMTWRR